MLPVLPPCWEHRADEHSAEPWPAIRQIQEWSPEATLLKSRTQVPGQGFLMPRKREQSPHLQPPGSQSQAQGPLPPGKATGRKSRSLDSHQLWESSSRKLSLWRCPTASSKSPGDRRPVSEGNTNHIFLSLQTPQPSKVPLEIPSQPGF